MSIKYGDTWLELCNLAIARIGKPPISSLSEGSVTAGFCLTYLGEIIDQVCTSYDWMGLAARSSLARLLVTPEFGYLYQYQLPAGFERPIMVETDGDLPYVIEGDGVLTDSEYVNIVYVERPDDPSAIPPYLFRLFSAALALRLTTPLISSEAIVGRLSTEYNDSLVMARRADARRIRDNTLERDRGYAEYEDLR